MNSIKAIQTVSEVPSKLNKTETAVAANTLATARIINGTSFDGSANITTNNWGTSRTFTIGNASKSINGSENINWSLTEIGAATLNHTHNYLPLNGGTVTGATIFNSTIYGMNNIALARGSLWLSATGSNITCDYLRFGTNIIASDNNKRMYLIDTGGGRANVDMGDIKTYSLLLTNPAYPSVRFSENVRIEYDAGNDALYAAGTKLTSSGLRGFKATVCESTQYATIAGKKVFVQSDTPSGISTGDVWVQI